MANSWDRQEGESESWYACFTAYLTLGHARTLAKAYRRVHPDGSEDVSGPWRIAFRERRWRQRATDFDLTLFRDETKRTVVILGRSMRAFAAKTLKALTSKEINLRPLSWEETAKAFEVLLKVLTPETIGMLSQPQEEAKRAAHRPEEYDENGFLKEIYSDELRENDPGFRYPRETYEPPPPGSPPA